MRVGSSSPVPVIKPTDDVARLQHQASILKKALDGQKDNASQLLKMIDTKGKIVDIQA
jgi:hypothetical protein